MPGQVLSVEEAPKLQTSLPDILTPLSIHLILHLIMDFNFLCRVYTGFSMANLFHLSCDIKKNCPPDVTLTWTSIHCMICIGPDTCNLELTIKIDRCIGLYFTSVVYILFMLMFLNWMHHSFQKCNFRKPHSYNIHLCMKWLNSKCSLGQVHQYPII